MLTRFRLVLCRTPTVSWVHYTSGLADEPLREGINTYRADKISLYNWDVRILPALVSVLGSLPFIDHLWGRLSRYQRGMLPSCALNKKDLTDSMG